jgi:hypothetical protein
MRLEVPSSGWDALGKRKNSNCSWELPEHPSAVQPVAQSPYSPVSQLPWLMHLGAENCHSSGT